MEHAKEIERNEKERREEWAKMEKIIDELSDENCQLR